MEEEKKSFGLGVFYTLISVSCLSLSGLQGKWGLERFTMSALVFWRYFAAFFFCVILLWTIGKLHGVVAHFKNVKMHLLRTFFVLIAQYSFYFYLEANTLMNATLLFNTGPMFTPLLERIFLGTAIGRSTWVGLVISFIGVVLVLQPDRDILTWMSFVGVLSGLAQGASQVVFGINSQAERSDLGVLYLLILAPLFTLPYYFLEGGTWISSPPSWNWTLLSVLGLGITVVGNQLFRAEAYAHSTPSRLSVFMYFSILLAGVFDWAFFGNLPNLLSILGAILIILGGALKIYLRHRILKNQKL